MIVADSNLIAYLLIPGNKTELAESVLRKDISWAVPLICRSELRNILTLYMRHRGMSLYQAIKTMEMAENLWRGREYAVPSAEVLELTSRHNITSYDAEFVVLARQLKISLITFDKAIQKAFPDIAVPADKF